MRVDNSICESVRKRKECHIIRLRVYAHFGIIEHYYYQHVREMPEFIDYVYEYVWVHRRVRSNEVMLPDVLEYW
jgi:hypothetical protein